MEIDDNVLLDVLSFMPDDNKTKVSANDSPIKSGYSEFRDLKNSVNIDQMFSNNSQHDSFNVCEFSGSSGDRAADTAHLPWQHIMKCLAESPAKGNSRDSGSYNGEKPESVECETPAGMSCVKPPVVNLFPYMLAAPVNSSPLTSQGGEGDVGKGLLSADGLVDVGRAEIGGVSPGVSVSRSPVCDPECDPSIDRSPATVVRGDTPPPVLEPVAIQPGSPDDDRCTQQPPEDTLPPLLHPATFDFSLLPTNDAPQAKCAPGTFHVDMKTLYKTVQSDSCEINADIFDDDITDLPYVGPLTTSNLQQLSNKCDIIAPHSDNSDHPSSDTVVYENNDENDDTFDRSDHLNSSNKTVAYDVEAEEVDEAPSSPTNVVSAEINTRHILDGDVSGNNNAGPTLRRRPPPAPPMPRRRARRGAKPSPQQHSDNSRDANSNDDHSCDSIPTSIGPTSAKHRQPVVDPRVKERIDAALGLSSDNSISCDSSVSQNMELLQETAGSACNTGQFHQLNSVSAGENDSCGVKLDLGHQAAVKDVTVNDASCISLFKDAFANQIDPSITTPCRMSPTHCDDSASRSSLIVQLPIGEQSVICDKPMKTLPVCENSTDSRSSLIVKLPIDEQLAICENSTESRSSLIVQLPIGEKSILRENSLKSPSVEETSVTKDRLVDNADYSFSGLLDAVKTCSRESGEKSQESPGLEHEVTAQEKPVEIRI